eukprot:jgi/Botrbrau1/6533/Bobra.40_2s0005.1
MLAWSATPNLHIESARLPLFFPHFWGFSHHTYFWDSVRVLRWDFGWYMGTIGGPLADPDSHTYSPPTIINPFWFIMSSICLAVF